MPNGFSRRLKAFENHWTHSGEIHGMDLDAASALGIWGVVAIAFADSALLGMPVDAIVATGMPSRAESARKRWRPHPKCRGAEAASKSMPCISPECVQWFSKAFSLREKPFGIYTPEIFQMLGTSEVLIYHRVTP